MRWKVRRGLVLLLLWIGATSSRADVAHLRNGRSIEVSAFRVTGESVVLSISGGGEMALPLREVLEIRRQPSEVRMAGPASPTLISPPADSADQDPLLAPSGPAGPAPGSDTTSAEASTMIDDEGREIPLPLPVGGVFDRDTLKAMAGRIARRHGVDESLVHAVIQVESRYDAFAVSPRGAMGLMQLMPKTAARFDVDNAFNPVENVDAGVRYLKELLDRYSGQPRLALAAYNAGEEAVERYSGIPPYRETIDYVRRVLGLTRR